MLIPSSSGSAGEGREAVLCGFDIIAPVCHPLSNIQGGMEKYPQIYEDFIASFFGCL